MYSNNDWRDYTELYHHGIKGQKWGVRRYQNSDGSLTAEGREHYGIKTQRSESVIDGKVSFSKTKNPMRTIEATARKLGQDPEKAKDEFRKSVVKQLEKDYKTSKYDNEGFADAVKSIKPVIDEIKNDPEVKKASDAMLEFGKSYNDFWSDNNKDADGWRPVDKYSILAGIAYANGNNDSELDKKNHIRWYVWDDGDPGTSFSYYLLDKGVNLQQYEKQQTQLQSDYQKALTNAVDKYMGDYSNKRLNASDDRSVEVSTMIQRNIDYIFDKDSDWTFGGAHDMVSSGSDKYDAIMKDELEQAKKEYDKWRHIKLFD